MNGTDKAHENHRSIKSKINDWFHKDHICVLTIGKTASSSIIKSLNNIGISAYQVHSLSRSPQDYLFLNGLKQKRIKSLLYQIKMLLWQMAITYIEKKIIVVFRDPFERNISAFFEQCWKMDIDPTKIEKDELFKDYKKYGPHDSTRLWFDENIKKCFKIDQEDVDLKINPWKIIKKNNISILFLKYERIDTWVDALKEFIGETLLIDEQNISSRKKYSSAIKDFKHAWKPDDYIIRKTIDKKLWASIYTKQERDNICDKWSLPKNI